jgi:hypothetical protein
MSLLQYSNLTSPVEKDIQGSIPLPATVNAGQGVYVQFANNPRLPAVLDNYYLTPSTENDILFGIYVDSSLSIDGYLAFAVNDIDTNIVFGKLNPTLISLQNPVKFDHNILVPANAKLEITFIPATSSTAGTTESVNFRLMRVPLGYKGNIIIPK